MILKLPEPRTDSDISLERTLLNRRSVREYADTPLTIEEVSQLLWAAQGVTSESGKRTAASAGSRYPLEVYLIAGNVSELAPGVYKYRPNEHDLVRTKEGDIKDGLVSACREQNCVRRGTAYIAITAVYARTMQRYGERGIRYVYMDVGHAAQNLYLQATALGLGMVVAGAFEDEQLAEVLGLPEDEKPLYVIPVGRQK